MEIDRERWNKKYSEGVYVIEPSEFVRKYCVLSPGKKALDIAAGLGRNSKYLISQGFDVDALELSDVAVKKLKTIKGVKVFQVDLDEYSLPQNEYDLIICINYLNRKLFPQIKKALNPGGVLIYETLMHGKETEKLKRNPDFLVKEGELLQAFNDLELIEYKEFITTGKNNVKVNKALFVGRKPR